MDARERVKSLLKQAKRALEIDDSVRLILYPMKYKVASVSLKTKTIRLNKNLIRLFTDDELRYILVHELIHVKLTTLNHGEEFYKLLRSFYSPEKSEGLENRIAEKLITANLRSERWLT